MHFSVPSTVLMATTAMAVSIPDLDTRQAGNVSACFIVGNTALPSETVGAAKGLVDKVTCDASKPQLGKNNIPDMSAGGVTYSAIDFSQSNLSPVGFALQTFATANPLSSTDAAKFQAMGQVYTATEIALRSIGDRATLGKLKGPKFFLAFQNSRIATANGNPPTDPSQTVEHLLGKVLKNAPGASQQEKDAVTALSKVLA